MSDEHNGANQKCVLLQPQRPIASFIIFGFAKSWVFVSSPRSYQENYADFPTVLYSIDAQIYGDSKNCIHFVLFIELKLQMCACNCLGMLRRHLPVPPRGSAPRCGRRDGTASRGPRADADWPRRTTHPRAGRQTKTVHI